MACEIVVIKSGSQRFVKRLGKSGVKLLQPRVSLHIKKVFQFSVFVVSSYGSAGAS